MRQSGLRAATRRADASVATGSPSPSIWFKGHNNPRYAELLPRLERLDRYLAHAPDGESRAVSQYRAYRWSSTARYPSSCRARAPALPTVFTADNEQIPLFDGPIVSDVDDPFFTEREVELLKEPEPRRPTS